MRPRVGAEQDEQYCVVASWRDSASQEAQDDLDGLLNDVLPFAQQQLDKNGAFFPYGMVIGASGYSRMIAADLGNGEQPACVDVLALLVDGLRRDRDQLRAVALVSDVRTADSDAVRVELEHREGAAMAVLLPYIKKRFRRGVEYGSLAGVTASPIVW